MPRRVLLAQVASVGFVSSAGIVTTRRLVVVLLIVGSAISRAELPLFSGWNGRNTTLVLGIGIQTRLLKRLNQRVLVSLQVVDGLLHVLKFLAHLIALLNATLKLTADLCDHFDASLQFLVCIIRRRS